MADTQTPPQPSGSEPAKSASPKSGKPKKKKKSSESRVRWSVQAGQFWQRLRPRIIEVFKGFGSPDRPTRRMSYFFFLSLIGVIFVASATLLHFAQMRAESLLRQGVKNEGAASGIEGFLNKQAEENKQRFSMAELGQFTLELKPVPGARLLPGITNMAEIDIVIECDNPDTHTYIEQHLVQARNQVTGAFFGMEREELLSREGKYRLKRLILEKLNTWLPKGKIENVFFTKLTVA